MTLTTQEQDYVIQVRRFLHQNPECSMQEKMTSSFIEEELKKYGIKVQRVGKTGIYGELSHIIDPKTAKNIGLRADSDALPVVEATNLDYASINTGVMHACGHDAHTAALLGAAKRLSQNRDQLNGTVKFIFQHAEEICQGAKDFIVSGVIGQMDRILAVHMCSSLPVGKMSLRSGECSASCDKFVIRVQGKSAHAATPHHAVDALYVGSQIVVNLQSILSRQINPIETGVVSVCSIHAGTAYNIIPDTCIIEGTTRAFSQNIRTQLNGKIKQITENIAKAYDADATVEIIEYTRPLINDADAAKEVEETAIELFGPSISEHHYSKVMLGDDFAEFLSNTKGMYVWVGSSDGENTATSFPLHHPQFNINEKAVLMASELYEAYARKILKQVIF